jgi:hypothetical protein
MPAIKFTKYELKCFEELIHGLSRYGEFIKEKQKQRKKIAKMLGRQSAVAESKIIVDGAGNKA